MNQNFSQSDQNELNPKTQQPINDLARIFNSALIATHLEPREDVSSELYALVESPEYQALLQASQLLSKQQGLSPREAAEKLIKTFRKLDRLWGEYLLREGADRLRGRTAQS